MLPEAFLIESSPRPFPSFRVCLPFIAERTIIDIFGLTENYSAKELLQLHANCVCSWLDDKRRKKNENKIVRFRGMCCVRARPTRSSISQIIVWRNPPD